MLLLRFICYSLLVLLSLGCRNANDTPSPEPNPSVYFPPIGSSDWATSSPESLGWNTANLPALYDYLRSTQTRAFLVLKDGKIVLEQYFGQNLAGNAPFTQSSLWYWASAGKTLTAFMVGKAQEDGFLALSDRSAKYLGQSWTSAPLAKENLITIRHHLTMTSGLEDNVANPDNTQAASLVYKADAGTRWAYHNAPYTLLEKVITQAVGQDFDDYFNAKLKNKIGMDGQWLWNGNNHVYYSTARSMARFGLLMLNKGKWETQTIMSNTDYHHASINTSQNLNLSYGYLWWLNGKASAMVPQSQIVFPVSISPDAPMDMVAAMGKNGQYLNIVPSKNLLMIRMGDSSDNSFVPMTYQNEIWKRLNAVIR